MSDIKENTQPAETEKKEGKSGFITFCKVTLILAFFIFIGFGFYKLADGSRYVGGDAYNFIINASKATAFFVAAFGSLVSVILIEIYKLIKEKLK